MTLRVWWAKEAELLPWNVLQDRAPVIRLDDLREVVEGLERISNPDQSALKATTDFIGMTTELVRLLNQGRDEAEKLLAQLKGVGDE